MTCSIMQEDELENELKKKLRWIWIALIFLSLILVSYLYKLIVARSMFETPVFFLVLVLGVIAFLLIIKGVLQAKSDIEKYLHSTKEEI